MTRAAGLLAPAPSAGKLARARGVLLILLLVVGLIALGFALVKLIGLVFGGVGNVTAVWAGVLLILAVLGVLALVGRRRQAKARAARGLPG